MSENGTSEGNRLENGEFPCNVDRGTRFIRYKAVKTSFKTIMEHAYKKSVQAISRDGDFFTWPHHSSERYGTGCLANYSFRSIKNLNFEWVYLEYYQYEEFKNMCQTTFYFDVKCSE